jgi:hypothetical protein
MLSYFALDHLTIMWSQFLAYGCCIALEMQELQQGAPHIPLQFVQLGRDGHPMRDAIEKFLVHFNEYWVENMHSRIQETTLLTDDASNIIKQAYLLGTLRKMPNICVFF